ncbi:phage antirepressor KilAC domain-containing protein [Devosia sp. A369]
MNEKNYIPREPPGLPVQTGNVPTGTTMTTRDISDLVEKRHDNVMRDTKAMFDALEMSALSFEGSYIGDNGKSLPLYNLPRDLTMTLVTGYSIPLRKKVIDRLNELERRQPDPSAALNNPATLRHLLLENVEKVLALEAEVVGLQPKADSYDFLTRADGTMCITDAAKALEKRPKDLFAWLQQQKWIYRRAGNGHWVGYQDKIQSGLLDHRVEEVTRADGSSKITEQVRITAKGMARLGELVSRAAA